MGKFEGQGTRFLTGAVLVAVVVAIGLIDNFFLIWLFLGIVYLFAFYEAMRLFGIAEQNHLYAYAAITWLLALFYPNPDDLFFLIAIFSDSFFFIVVFLNRCFLFIAVFPDSFFLIAVSTRFFALLSIRSALLIGSR